MGKTVIRKGRPAKVKPPLLGNISDHYRPVPYMPFLDEAVLNIWIMFCEFFRYRGVFRAKHQQRAVRGVSKRAGKLKFASSIRLSSEAKMFLTKRDSLVHKIVNQFIVKESVIVLHGKTLFLAGSK
jgi:hypothetical protein